MKHLAERKGHKRGYIVKARQFGFTTIYCIDMLDDALWVPGMSCAILAHERETLDKIFQIVKRAYENLRPEIKPKARTDTLRTYRFDTSFDNRVLDSEIYVALKLRGGTVRRLHITESAYIKDRQELKIGSKQAVPKDGYISEETTGNGMEAFYDDYMESYTKLQNNTLSPMDYYPYFYAWFENPEYSLEGTLTQVADTFTKYGDEEKMRATYHLNDNQLLWRRWKIDEIRSKGQGTGLNALQRFMQEYPSTMIEAFQSGVGSVFNLEMVMKLLAKTPLDPLIVHRLLTSNWTQLDAQTQEDYTNIEQKFLALHKLGVNVWHLPEKGAKYVLGADPSDGQGSDNTGIDIWKIPKEATEKIVQVAQYYGHIRPDQGAELAKLMAELYNDAFSGIENNMLTFMLFFSKIYDNYYMEVEIDKKTQRRSTRLGWNTNTKTRDPMIDDFAILFEDGYLEINSLVTIAEMKTFVKKDNGKREHADSKHDDALFGGMIALQMRKYEPRRSRAFTHKPPGF